MKFEELRSSKKTSMSKVTIFLAIVVVAAAIGISATLYSISTAVLTTGEVHSSNSPISPLINEKDAKPLVDPNAALVQQNDANSLIPKP